MRMFSTKRQIHPLDESLLSWKKRDAFTVRQLLNGGVAIFGQTGSGKTSSSGRLIGEAIVSLPSSGGLILAAKPSDAGMWEGIFARAHRSSDLLVFSPDSPAGLKFDFLDYEMRHGGHTRNITRCIRTIGENLRRTDGARGGREEAEFFKAQEERLIYNAVEVVKLATGRITAPELQEFITTAAQSTAEISSLEWQAGFHNQCVRAAYARDKSSIEARDFKTASDFWLHQFPVMSDRTRSCIIAGVMGLLHVFNSGVVAELVSNGSNVTPDVLFEGKWVLVDMAPNEWGDLGSFVSAGWKYLTQRRVLRRKVTDGDPICVIWTDEAWQFVNSYDQAFLAQCRSHLGCMVMLAQSIHSFHSAMAGHDPKHEAEALLSNFHTKVVHLLGDFDSASWASNLLGRELKTFINGSTPPPQGVFDAMMGVGNFSGGFSEHYEPVLEPRAFMSGLRSGGPAADYLADAYVIRSGEPFSTGANWLPVTFSQKPS